jgi:hypothetical protein
MGWARPKRVAYKHVSIRFLFSWWVGKLRITILKQIEQAIASVTSYEYKRRPPTPPKKNKKLHLDLNVNIIMFIISNLYEIIV